MGKNDMAESPRAEGIDSIASFIFAIPPPQGNNNRPISMTLVNCCELDKSWGSVEPEAEAYVAVVVGF